MMSFYQMFNYCLQVILSPATHLFLDAPLEPDPVEPGWYWATRYTDQKKIFEFMPNNLFLNADVTAMGTPVNMTQLCQNNGCPFPTKPENIIGKFRTGITITRLLVEQIPWASFQGGGLRSTTFVAIYQNVRFGL